MSGRSILNAFTLIELLIVIAIVALLAAILFPVFAQVREKARQTTCASNLHQLGLALKMYADNYDDTWTASTYPNALGVGSDRYWNDAIFSYVKNRRVYYCPSDPDAAERETSYSWPFPHLAYRYPLPGAALPAGASLESFRPELYFSQPADVMALVDGIFRWPGIGYIFSQYVYCSANTNGGHIPAARAKGSSPFGNIAPVHAGGANILFLDGHVGWWLLQRAALPGPDSALLLGHLK